MKTTLVRAALTCITLAVTGTAVNAAPTTNPKQTKSQTHGHGGTTPALIDIQAGQLKQNPKYTTIKPLPKSGAAISSTPVKRPSHAVDSNR